MVNHRVLWLIYPTCLKFPKNLLMITQIRQANSHEARALSGIAIRAKHSNGYSDSFMEACRKELTFTGKDISNGEYWVAEADVVQGFVCLTEAPAQRAGEITSFFIEPEWQRKGIGKLLWKKILKRAMEKSIHTLFLDSDPAAVPFYKSLGFAVIGQVPSGSISGRTIPRMKLQLS